MDQATEHSTAGPVATSDRAAALIDELRRQETILGATQARRAQLMVEFADTRRRLDQQRISEHEAAGGGDARYRAGEFAVTEISLAVTASKHHIHRTTAMARRLQAEAPDVWDCWSAGDIDQDKAIRINRALRRLVHDRSKKLLNQLVIDVAPHKTPELLGRWLNQFIAQVEPDETDERLRRSFEDRYVSIRPDIDGISFLHAALSCVDAAAIDQLLSALAAVADPGDSRTHAQRRADALVDILCGRVSNGCHITWDTNTDTDDHLDDPDPADRANTGDDGGGGVDPIDGDDTGDGADPTDRGGSGGDRCDGVDSGDGIDGRVGPPNAGSAGPTDREPAFNAEQATGRCSTSGESQHDRGNTSTGKASTDSDLGDPDAPPCSTPATAATITGPADDWVDVDANPDHDGADSGSGSDATDWPDPDWDQPASTFRPAPPTNPDAASDRAAEKYVTTSGQPARTPPGAWQLTPCPGDHQKNPLPVHIGIVITAASLFGHTNTPGQLQDRSSLIAADHIRRLAAQPGTLFHRLITDEQGNLLDVTELGRFPSRKLGIAIDYRDGTCTNPTCHTPAHRCDRDHVIPHPDGPTTGINLNNDCRPEHRAKTHGGHQTSRPTPHTSTWTTPTGHEYRATDPPLPVEPFPLEPPPAEPPPAEPPPAEPPPAEPPAR